MQTTDPNLIGKPITVPSMPGRGGEVDATSTKPGELIVRADDHWYLADKVKVEEESVDLY